MKRVKLFCSNEDIYNNNGDFRKHFNNEMFLNFTNIKNEATPNKMMIYYSGGAKELLATAEAIYIGLLTAP